MSALIGVLLFFIGAAWDLTSLLLLQIATFFSNNLDFFTSSGYSPRGSTLALNPLQAETMLANKKKAAAYIQAIKKVSMCLNLCYAMFSAQYFDCNFAIQIQFINNKTIVSLFSPGHSLFRTEKPCQTVVY